MSARQEEKLAQRRVTHALELDGRFVVRWNGHDRVKEIRKYQEGSADPGRGASRVDVIPERYWKN